jgi:hypothetical protein
MKNWVLPAVGVVLIAAGGALALGVILILMGRKTG